MNLLFAEDLAGFFSNPLNYFLDGEEIFPPKSWLLRPYPDNLTDSHKVFSSSDYRGFLGQLGPG